MPEMQTITMVNDLLRGLRHELSNLTTVLNLNVGLLEHSAPTETSRLELAELKVNLGDLGHLLARLRLYPQPQADAELFDLVHVALNAAEATGGADKPPIICLMPTSPVWVQGSEVNLCSALCEVLNNALEATMRAKGETIKLTMRVTAETVTLLIIDDGPGFTAEELVTESPFAPGYTTKVNNGFVRGLGFGLFMARAVIDLHKGAITLRNCENGHGLVKITLPHVGLSIQ